MTRRYDPRRLADALVELELTHVHRILPRRFAATPLGSGPADNRFASIDAEFSMFFVASEHAFLLAGARAAADELHGRG